MPLTEHVALVSLTSDTSTRSLLQVAAALQKQVTRDFSAIWNVRATVDAFADLSSVPNDYYPVVVFRDPADMAQRLEVAVGEEKAALLVDYFAGDRIAGIHLNAFTRQPFALVAASDSWSVTTSHEVLEMLADPFGSRLKAAAHPTRADQRVRYLLEVCDPCLSVYYAVNGISVSDFYTPRYFDPVRFSGTRYSFTGEIQYPRQILEGGYLTWIDPGDSGLYQLQSGSNEPVLLAGLPELARSREPLRTLVDGNPATPQVEAATLRPARSAPAAAGGYEAVQEASDGNALTTAEALLTLAADAG